MEKKTIEEAAEHFAHNNFDMHETNHYKGLYQGFKAGAEWYASNQSEQMYGEGSMVEFGNFCINLPKVNKQIIRDNPEITTELLLQLWIQKFKKS